MSHFVCVVIGDDPVKQLAPFAEQWDDGEAPDTIEFDDKTEELKQDYETGTTEAVRTPDTEEWISIHSDRYRKYSDKTKGELDKVEVGFKMVYPTFKEFAKRWGGYEPDGEGRYGYWHNPQAKWDWYELGGRWAGFFRLKKDTEGLAGEQYARTAPKHKTDGKVDATLWGYVDIERQRDEAAAEANAQYTKYEEACKDVEHMAESWSRCRERFPDNDEGLKAARDEYAENAWVKALRNANLDSLWDDSYKTWYVNEGGRERYVKRARDTALVPFAILHNGKWYQSGEMGWWGMTTDKMDENEWEEQVAKLYDSLADDVLVCAYDLHI